MKMAPTPCAFCGSLDEYTVVYRQNFKESDCNKEVFSARRIPDRVHYQIVRCANDNSIRSNPVLEESSLRELYRESRFTYAQETENLAVSYAAILAPILHSLPKDAGILEIGCGNGFLLRKLYDLGYTNISGIELSADAAAQSDTAIRNRITRDDLRPDTFGSRTFDLICCFQLLDHLPEPNNFLRLCAAALSPGGFVVAMTHDAESPQARLLKEYSPIIDIEHIYFFDARSIKKIFENNGFVPVKIYSPAQIVSFRHILLLLPLPKRFKTWIASVKAGALRYVLRQKIKIAQGNICIIAKKVSTG